MQDMVDGVWRYTSDNSLVTFFDWDSTQPNGGSSADCAVLYADRNYSWADHVCVIVGDYTAYAICEAKRSSPILNVLWELRPDAAHLALREEGSNETDTGKKLPVNVLTIGESLNQKREFSDKALA
ncbi:hypothetical protein MAR_019866 [Mya arenaria]|uniref:C-type lectin domain-containing protein n=1 Tax=Mya arenaria TaxID=6604 RepID=A0ABY7E6R8_MYAAR|nr:hypothetical protein MAR_019866 [Mya arenaria]